MQRLVLLGALMSLVVLAAASPTPGAISKRSLEQDKIDSAVVAEGHNEKREELKTDFIIYAWYDGPGTGD
ncbi:hypothetical protein P692DRAFT_20726931 [Suillus brevipes Sb2]|nr:hypothetical protein P692DRAFT_20726931 [Suillus brevipes Sb2]